MLSGGCHPERVKEGLLGVGREVERDGLSRRATRERRPEQRSTAINTERVARPFAVVEAAELDRT